jgi:hypothetical protein
MHGCQNLPLDYWSFVMGNFEKLVTVQFLPLILSIFGAEHL